MSFEKLGLSEPLLRAVHAADYHTPTPIQVQAIPAVLGKADILAAAQTGTGKTAGFVLPILQRLDNRTRVKSNHTRALVLTPTRELAAQIHDSILTYGKYLQLRSAAVFGGVNITPQMQKLYKGLDILVATPGRLLDLYEQKAVCFDDIEFLVLDEADRMLDLGFIRDIKKIINLLPTKRQTLLFSATFDTEIRHLSRSIMHKPVEIDVSPRNSTVAAIAQKIHPVDRRRKAELLSHLVRTGNWSQVLVFSRTKHGADKLVKRLLRDNINVDAIHGDKSQAQRTRALAGFKKYKSQVLVATDIASRGLDIDQLSHVVNFDLPDTPEDYIHRIGRTGRAGATGTAISLVCLEEIKQLKDIERLIKRSIEREDIKGFEPVCTIPITNPDKPASSRPRHKPGGRLKNLRPARRLGGNRFQTT
jgi:ATP-dependent RNA helicase RhlE